MPAARAVARYRHRRTHGPSDRPYAHLRAARLRLPELLGRPGYHATRYRSDSATVFVEDQQVIAAG